MIALGELQAALQDARMEAATLRIENTRLHTGEGHAGCDVQTCEIAAVASDEASEAAEERAKNTPLRDALRSAVDALRLLAVEVAFLSPDACAECGGPPWDGEHCRLCGRMRAALAVLGKPTPPEPAVTGTTSDKPCDRCKGTGYAPGCSADDRWPHNYACRACRGTGGRSGFDPVPDHLIEPAVTSSAPPLTHAFLPAPFYPERCDARVEDDGKRRQCGQSRSEHAG